MTVKLRFSSNLLQKLTNYLQINLTHCHTLMIGNWVNYFR